MYSESTASWQPRTLTPQSVPSMLVWQGVAVLRLQPQIGRPIADMADTYREWQIDFGDSGYVVRYRTASGPGFIRGKHARFGFLNCQHHIFDKLDRKVRIVFHSLTQACPIFDLLWNRAVFCGIQIVNGFGRRLDGDTTAVRFNLYLRANSQPQLGQNGRRKAHNGGVAQFFDFGLHCEILVNTGCGHSVSQTSNAWLHCSVTPRPKASTRPTRPPHRPAMGIARENNRPLPRKSENLAGSNLGSRLELLLTCIIHVLENQSPAHKPLRKTACDDAEFDAILHQP